MNPNKQKLETRTEAELQHPQSVVRGQEAREYESVEELLREDAARQTPPPELAERVAASVRSEPGPSRSWWTRLFGGGAGSP